MTTRDERLAESLRVLNSLTPIALYFSLNKKACRAGLMELLVDAKGAIGVRVAYNGSVYTNLGKVGRDMRSDLREKTGSPPGTTDTFEGKRKLKVVIDGTVVRYRDLVPLEVETGAAVATLRVQRPRHAHQLQEILMDPANVIIDGAAHVPPPEVSLRQPKRARHRGGGGDSKRRRVPPAPGPHRSPTVLSLRRPAASPPHEHMTALRMLDPSVRTNAQARALHHRLRTTHPEVAVDIGPEDHLPARMQAAR